MELPLKYEDVVSAYQLLLGREPENQLICEQMLNVHKDVLSLTKAILNSQEFNSKECIDRLILKQVNKKSVITAYTLLLGYLPENDEIINNKIGTYKNIHALINGINETKNNIKFIVKNRFFNQTPKLIYLHIPKTAGSSFHHLASKNFDGRVSLAMPSNIIYEKWIQSIMVGGHYFYSDYDGMTTDRLFLCVIRNPVDRAFSLFNYYKHAKDGMEDQRIKLGFNPASLRLTIENSNIRQDFVDNCQCLYLAGERNFGTFQKVINNDYFIIGTFDKLDDWLRYLGEKLRWKSVTMPKVNTAHDSTYMDKLKSDGKLVGLIRDLNNEDMKLYEFIKSKGIFTNCSSDFNFDKFIQRAS